EDYIVPESSPADFAARISGDSMEPIFRDGDVALVKRCPIENGDVGLFFVDGDMKCKQYCRDNFGNVYLLSVNRARADADSFISASSGLTLCCFGKVLLERRPPLPIK
ncbi:MAG: S24 family peptidase, partial [Clostridia bacterium]|nr:S24 family peptidase [Clostridia bacterium]